jgi:hypothetical protein
MFKNKQHKNNKCGDPPCWSILSLVNELFEVSYVLENSHVSFLVF